ncbi:MAG TPA: segregation/condensation protein A [Chitinophagaceae bacterium]|nr:segregation/condensation protein A [Chitinophagaceae bacterium]
MADTATYTISLPQFEGPFDLLLFFIERDELDIYDIPISKLIHDFTDYIHELEELNIELASEFILFVSVLMRIKSKMLLPRKELDEEGNEVDPREELIQKLLEYKKYKKVAAEMAEKEAERILRLKRGNIEDELNHVGLLSGEGTEMQTLSLYKLLNTFQKVAKELEVRQSNPEHVVYRYNYTMEESRDYMKALIRRERSVSFEHIFARCYDRLQAIFLFLSVLELVQQKFMKIMLGEGRNNFLLEYENSEEANNTNI